MSKESVVVAVDDSGASSDDQCAKDTYGYSPVIESQETLIDIALAATDFIDKTRRQAITFNKYASENNIHEVPLCSQQEVFLDTGSNAKQTGRLTEDVYKEVLKTKKICSQCPVRDICLAVSLTQPRMTRASKNEKSIPGTEGAPLVMSTDLIYGGITPQERNIVFDLVCEELSVRDEMEQ